MTSSQLPKIWIDPPRYWAATANMSPEQVEAVLQEISAMAEAGQIDKLQKYDFVLTENPYISWQRARKSAA